MSFCASCGTRSEESALFCSACGKTLAEQDGKTDSVESTGMRAKAAPSVRATCSEGRHYACGSKDCECECHTTNPSLRAKVNPQPPVSKKQTLKTPIVRAPFKLLGIVVVLILIGMLLIGMLFGPTSPSPTSAKPVATNIDTPPKQEPSDKDNDLQLHLNDAKWLDDQYEITAGVACREPVEKLAKYNFEWFDTWSEQKFDSYYSPVRAPGILVVTGDKIKFQNGFGAWQIMKYECTYDVVKNVVADVSAEPR